MILRNMLNSAVIQGPFSKFRRTQNRSFARQLKIYLNYQTVQHTVYDYLQSHCFLSVSRGSHVDNQKSRSAFVSGMLAAGLGSIATWVYLIN